MTPKDVKIAVYVLPSGSKKTDVDKVIEVCSQFAETIIKVESLLEANQKMGNIIVPGSWNLIIYDDEIPEPAFVRNIKEVLYQNPNDVLVVFKRGKDQAPSKCPRLFRAGIACRNDCVCPVSETVKVGNYAQGFLLGIAKYV